MIAVIALFAVAHAEEEAAEDVVSVEKRNADANAEPEEYVRKVFPLLSLFTHTPSPLEEIGNWRRTRPIQDHHPSTK